MVRTATWTISRTNEKRTSDNLIITTEINKIGSCETYSLTHLTGTTVLQRIPREFAPRYSNYAYFTE